MTVKQLKEMIEVIKDDSAKVAIKVKGEDRAIVVGSIAVYDYIEVPNCDKEFFLPFIGCEGEYCNDKVLVFEY